jgi:hypothetical protein
LQLAGLIELPALFLLQVLLSGRKCVSSLERKKVGRT